MSEELKYALTLKGEAEPPGIRLISGIIEGEINGVPKAQIEFMARDKALDLQAYVGTDAGFWVETFTGKRQTFWGVCISVHAIGVQNGEGHYIAELRPWLWLLSRSRNNRIFQEMTATEIIHEILGIYGFSGDLVIKHAGEDPVRTYCVQYRETDLNFIKRLLEDEGVYFYFEHDDGACRMVLSDQPDNHESVSDMDKFIYRDERGSSSHETVLTWEKSENAVTGKVSLRDYDFTKPSSDLTVTSILPSGDHPHKSYEAYTYPGGYSDVSVGEAKAAALIEAEASGHEVWKANSNILNLNVGKLFELVDHPRHVSAADNGFMVTTIRQFFRTKNQANMTIRSALQTAFDSQLNAQDFFATTFDAVLKSKPFQMPKVTPRPEMFGVQTAVVAGPAGEETSVDNYGRIKVKFHWDRRPETDETASCWVRTMMPWTGKGWGMIGLPRIGQEVVIQFEEGDPDRPICVGMVYNADNMPPYALPGNATRTGIKTNSSKGGGGYNELMLEDKKGDELVRFMAEKDFVQNVQNQSHVKIGYDHGNDVKKAEAQADKSMKLEVKEHLDEIVESGDHSFEVQTGKQTIKIKKDKTETVEGKVNLTVTKDKTTTVKMGNVSETVSTGDKETKVSMGNIKVDADLGKIDITAMQSITLKVGANSVKIDQMGVTITGMIVKIEGKTMLEAKAPLTQVKGDAILILKGGLTMIN